MSEKFKVRESEWPYFVTFTVIRWIDVFTRPIYKNIVVDSLNYCIEKKGLKIHAWVLMTNHLHLLIDTEKVPIGHIVRDFKTFTSKKIIETIEQNPNESRDWLIYLFENAGKFNNMNEKYQFWQNGYHPIHCWNHELIKQKINYIHQNPVRAEFVNNFYDWKYGSAENYVNGQGLVKVEMLDIY